MPNPHIYADEMAALDAASNDGQPARDAQHFRRIVAARTWVALAQAELVAAASAARGAGDSWTVIGAALGTTRQGAQRKFGRPKSREWRCGLPPGPTKPGRLGRQQTAARHSGKTVRTKSAGAPRGPT